MSLSRLPSPGSVVIDRVAASRSSYRRIGLVSSEVASTWRTIALRKACWRVIRLMSLPSPMWCRARSSASPWSPITTCGPGLEVEAGALAAADRVVQRRLQADVHAAERVDDVLDAVEVDDDEVVDRQSGDLLDQLDGAGRPADRERLVELALEAALGAAALGLHVGSVTQVSRGMLMTSARWRPWYRCTSITTSDCARAVDLRRAALAALADAGVRAHHEDVERRQVAGGRGGRRRRTGSASAQLVVGAGVDGDVRVQVPVDEVAAGRRQPQEQRERDAHGGSGPLPARASRPRARAWSRVVLLGVRSAAGGRGGWRWLAVAGSPRVYGRAGSRSS